MNAFERLLARGLDQLGEKLAAEPPQQREATLDAVRELSFPALLAVLGASGAAGGERGETLLRAAAEAAAARHPELAAAGFDAARIERVLRALLVERAPLANVVADPALRERVVELALAALAQHTGLAPEDVRAAAELLATGEFFGDVASSTAAVVRVVPRLPLALLQDVTRFPHRMLALGFALASDLVGTPFQVPAVLTDLADGRLDHPPAVLRRTIRRLYGFATLAHVLETLRTLLARDNRTMRLALLLYARANDVPLEERDIDRVMEALSEDSEGLGPLLVAGIERLRSEHDVEGALSLLRRLGRREEG